jgi:hypothetical protein
MSWCRPEPARRIIMIQHTKTKEVRFWYEKHDLPRGWKKIKLADQ